MHITSLHLPICYRSRCEGHQNSLKLRNNALITIPYGSISHKLVDRCAVHGSGNEMTVPAYETGDCLESALCLGQLDVTKTPTGPTYI